MIYESRYTFCCGPFRTSVETGTYWIAILGFVVKIIVAIYNSATFHSVLAGLFPLLCAICYLSVVFAQKKNNPSLFMPFLIVEGIGLVIYMLVYIMIAAITILAPQEIVDKLNKHSEKPITREMTSSILIFCLIIAGLYFALTVWFYSIIYRAYKMLKDAIATGRIPPV
uniref:MARVEL domain-containing protein n=1 Tax=Globodera pallida TaxID=36090 RepID=A0A183CFK2_GLOPA